ncbi:SMP-30/gluconolactonase/LRE family protein [Streptomyces sp. NPDC049040]|uniref:SMP-30/gluconolactonase/LRE family protein n=1 Tax=Streptomyces sp. NPDC049040 TaxID=3365593 RepID=UPI00371E28D2
MTARHLKPTQHATDAPHDERLRRPVSTPGAGRTPRTGARTARTRRAWAVAAAAGAAALLAAALGAPATAQPAPARRHHPAPPPQSIDARAHELYPESITWDPTRKAFLVGSARQGNVSVVGLDGTVKELTPSLGLVSTLGIKVDVPRNRIVVVYTDYWVRRLMQVDQPPTSGVAVINLRTGRLEKRIDTAQGRPDNFANDLAVDERTGTVYVTDSVSDSLQQIDLKGRVRVLLTDDRFSDDSIGLNGIEWSPGGYLLASRHDTGAVFKIPLTRHPVAKLVDVPVSMRGVDGLVLEPDGRLLAVQNTLGALHGIPGGIDAVTELATSDGWRTSRVVRQTDPWPVAGPTTVAIGGPAPYVLSGRLATLMTQSGVTDDFWLERLEF